MCCRGLSCGFWRRHGLRRGLRRGLGRGLRVSVGVVCGLGYGVGLTKGVGEDVGWCSSSGLAADQGLAWFERGGGAGAVECDVEIT